MFLSEISGANQLILELVKSGWRKSLNQNPLQDDPSAPYFRAVNIDNVVGRTFDHDYLRRIDIYPQGENLTEGIGLTALVGSDGNIIRWEIFCHYSGSYLLETNLSNLALNAESLRECLVEWVKKNP